MPKGSLWGSGEMSEERFVRVPAPATLAEEAVSPFLHDRGSCLYNPLTGVSIPKDGQAFLALSRLEQGLSPQAEPGVLEHLRAARFLIDDVDAEVRRSHLLFLSL